MRSAFLLRNASKDAETLSLGGKFFVVVQGG